MPRRFPQQRSTRRGILSVLLEAFKLRRAHLRILAGEVVRWRFGGSRQRSKLAGIGGQLDVLGIDGPSLSRCVGVRCAQGGSDARFLNLERLGNFGIFLLLLRADRPRALLQLPSLLLRRRRDSSDLRMLLRSLSVLLVLIDVRPSHVELNLIGLVPRRLLSRRLVILLEQRRRENDSDVGVLDLRQLRLSHSGLERRQLQAVQAVDHADGQREVHEEVPDEVQALNLLQMSDVVRQFGELIVGDVDVREAGARR